MRRWQVLIICLILTTIGLLSLKSIGQQYFWRQGLFLSLGLIGSLWLSQQQQGWRWRWAIAIYVLVICLLIFSQLNGQLTRGTRSWIPIGSFHLQPSQLAVMATLLGLGWSSRQTWSLLKKLTIQLVIVGLPLALVLTEPDFGSAMVLAAAAAAAIFLNPLPWKWWLGLGLSGLLVLGLGWQFGLKPYQKQRILSFWQPDQHQLASYNARQAVIAVGAGGWSGVGLGKGSQSHLRFLPERQTDFIFATWAEETGFIGSSIVIGLYGWLMLSLFELARRLSLGEQLLSGELIIVVGCLGQLLAQVAINIGMNIGLMPITGITLPFISYGGSSLISWWWQMGIISGIWMQQKTPQCYTLK